MRVWITRTEPGAQGTTAAVEALGHTPVVAPLLVVESVDVEPAPPDLESDGHDVAFTSPNGVAHYRGPTDTTAWCVGKATAKAARAAGFAEVRVGPGDVEGLTELLLAELERPIVHWAGAHVRGDLAGELGRAGHAATRVTAYQARAVETSPLDGLVDAPVDVVLLHSPRAADVFSRLAPDAARASVAISAAADAPLATIEGLKRWVADTPNEVGVLAALQLVEQGEAMYGLGAMDERDKMLDAGEALEPQVDAVKDPASVPTGRGVGWPALLTVGVASALLGAGGGWVLSRAVPDDRPDPSAALRSDIVQLREAQSSLSGQLGDLERAPETPPALQASMGRVETDLVALRERVEALDEQVESNKAGDAQDPATMDASAIAQLRRRLDALEDRSVAMPDNDDGSGPRPQFSPAAARRFSELDARLDELESEMRAGSGSAVPLPTPEISYRTVEGASPVAQASARPTELPAPDMPLPTFPRDAVLAALDAPEDGSAISRGLRRLVRVRSADAQDALDDLDAALAADDRTAALDAFSRLPDRAQAAAPRWAELADN